MRYPILLILLPLALASCTDPGGYSVTSPQERLAQAEGQIRATDAARVEQAAQATQQAAKEAGKAEAEIRRVMAPIQASQTAVVLKATEIAQAAAVVALEAQQAETAKQVELAAIEIERTKRREAIAATINDIWQVAWLALRIAIGGAFVLLLYFLPRSWLEHRIQQQQRESSILLLSDGTKIWFNASNEPEMIGAPTGGNGHEKRGLVDLNLSGNWGNGEPVRSIGSSGNVLASNPRRPDHTPTGQVLALVQKAMDVSSDKFTDKIPRWENLGISSATWQRVIGIMRYNKLVEVTELGTFVEGEYHNLVDLERALRMGKLSLRPVPPTPLPVAGD